MRTNHLYEFGNYRLDVENRVWFRGEQAVPRPPKTVELLMALAERRGEVVSKDQLMSLLRRDFRIYSAAADSPRNSSSNIAQQ